MILGGLVYLTPLEDVARLDGCFETVAENIDLEGMDCPCRLRWLWSYGMLVLFQEVTRSNTAL